MEDTHWALVDKGLIHSHRVLILVLMEDTHWVFQNSREAYVTVCLNPCFNGRYSLSYHWTWWQSCCLVLILVLMEDTHWVTKKIMFNDKYCVLILVLMEDTHWDMKQFDFENLACLNPCFNGRYSLRSGCPKLILNLSPVLILVLMEDTHWENIKLKLTYRHDGLNPCFNGRNSLRPSTARSSQFMKVLILVLMEDTHWEQIDNNSTESD